MAANEDDTFYLFMTIENSCVWRLLSFKNEENKIVINTSLLGLSMTAEKMKCSPYFILQNAESSQNGIEKLKDIIASDIFLDWKGDLHKYEIAFNAWFANQQFLASQGKEYSSFFTPAKEKTLLPSDEAADSPIQTLEFFEGKQEIDFIGCKFVPAEDANRVPGILLVKPGDRIFLSASSGKISYTFPHGRFRISSEFLNETYYILGDDHYDAKSKAQQVIDYFSKAPLFKL